MHFKLTNLCLTENKKEGVEIYISWNKILTRARYRMSLKCYLVVVFIFQNYFLLDIDAILYKRAIKLLRPKTQTNRPLNSRIPFLTSPPIHQSDSLLKSISPFSI